MLLKKFAANLFVREKRSNFVMTINIKTLKILWT